MHSQAPVVRLYMPACIHQHVDTHIYAQALMSDCVKVHGTSYIDAPSMFGSDIQMEADRFQWVTFQWEGKNLPEDFIYRLYLSVTATVIHLFGARETGQERGGEEGKKLPFSSSFPPNPPCSIQE